MRPGPGLLLTGLACLVAMHGVYAGERRTVTPRLAAFGPRSAVERTEYRVVTDAAAWKELWSRHQATRDAPAGAPKPAPTVDFSKELVVAVFQGRSSNSNGVGFEEVSEVDGELRVRFNDMSYQTVGPDGGGVRCTPWGYCVLPRPRNRVVMEENVQNLIGQPAIWRERYRVTVKPRS